MSTLVTLRLQRPTPRSQLRVARCGRQCAATLIVTAPTALPGFCPRHKRQLGHHACPCTTAPDFTLLQAGAGLQLSYENIFDYENPIQQANGGPGAKAVGAAVGRVLGLGSATTKARGSARVNAQYERDTWNSNSVTVGTVAQMSGGASGGLYLDRNEANENDALLETVEPNNFVFG
jgi:hypothetical protein